MSTNKKQKVYLVVYDIQEAKRSRQIVKLLNSCGVRVQKSVFECLLTEKTLNNLIKNLRRNLAEQDSIRVYPLDNFAVNEKILLGAIMYSENVKNY